MYVKINFRFNMNKKYLYTIMAGMMLVNLSEAMYGGTGLKGNNSGQQNHQFNRNQYTQNFSVNSGNFNSTQKNGIEQKVVAQNTASQNVFSQKASEFSVDQKKSPNDPNRKRNVVKKGDSYYSQTYEAFRSFIDPNIRYISLLLSFVESAVESHVYYKYGDYLSQIGESNISKLAEKIHNSNYYSDVEDKRYAKEMIKNDIKMVVVYKQLKNGDMGDDLDKILRSSNPKVFLDHEDLILKSKALKDVLCAENSTRAKFLLSLRKDYVDAELSPGNAYIKLLSQYEPKICAVDNKLCVNNGHSLLEKYKTWGDVSKLWLGTFTMYDIGASQYEIVLECIKYRTLVSKGDIDEVVRSLGFVFGKEFIVELMEKSNKLGYTRIADPKSHVN